MKGLRFQQGNHMLVFRLFKSHLRLTNMTKSIKNDTVYALLHKKTNKGENIGENKDADQLCSLCFFLNPKFQATSILL